MERNNIISECNYKGFKNNRLNQKCKKCNDKSYKSINGLIEKFPNIYRFCNTDLNKFALLLRKGVYPYEYMDSWERFNEESLQYKESFYNNLHLENITDEEYTHAQKVCEVFKIKNLGECHDLYVQATHYCLQLNLKILEINTQKYMNSILLISYLLQDQLGKLILKKNKSRIRLINRY